MGPVWARRSKASAGSSAKRRRVVDADNESQPVTQNGDGSARSAEPPAEEAPREKSPTQDSEKREMEAMSDPNSTKNKPAGARTTVPAQVADKARGPANLRTGPHEGHVRPSMAVDFQRDICKQYKLRGTCSYGDSCKFLHEREDHAAATSTTKDWVIAGKSTKAGGPRGGASENTKECVFCRCDPPQAAVKLACGHLSCESCFVKASKATDRKCRACDQRLGDSAESVTL